MNSTLCYAYESAFGGGGSGNLSLAPCNNVVGSPNLFTHEVEFSSYGYNQIAWAVYVFLALNAFGVAAHVALGIYWRTWWSLPTIALGTAVEVLGWAGRLWSLKSQLWSPQNGGFWYTNYNGFLMQIICLILGPTFFSAANYVLLSRLIRLTGHRYSSVTPDSFTLMFVVADIACLVIQGIGGGLAGTANDVDGANTGAYIMTAGVCLQLLVTVLFAILYFEFIWRYARRTPAKKQYDIALWFKCGGPRRRSREAREAYANNVSVAMSELGTGSSTPPDHNYASEGSSIGSPRKAGFHDEHPERRGRVVGMIWVLGLATLLITIRGVYRSIELTDGWTGPIAVNQPLFLGMDPLLMIILVLAYVVYHPGIALGRDGDKY